MRLRLSQLARLATLLAGVLLVSPVRRLLAAGLPSLPALRSTPPLGLQALAPLLSAVPTLLLPAGLALEPAPLAGLGLRRLLTPGLALLATPLTGLLVLARLSRLLTALLAELLWRCALWVLLAGPGLLSPSLLARRPRLLCPVAPWRLSLLSASGLALWSLRGALAALRSRLALGPSLSLLALLSGVLGLRLAPAGLPARLALRRLLLTGLSLPARLAVLPLRWTARLAVGAGSLLASLPGGVARSSLARRRSLLARTALLTALSAALFASALGVAVLPAHGGRRDGRTPNSD